MRYLVAYYSLTGKTGIIAKTIARELGAEIEPIRTEKPINVQDFTRFSISNISLIHTIISRKKIRINQPVYNVQDFDRVLIATPVWMNNPAPAINSYIGCQNFLNKDIVLIATILANGNAQNTFSVMNSAINKKGGRVIITREIDVGESSEPEIIESASQFSGILNSI